MTNINTKFQNAIREFISAKRKLYHDKENLVRVALVNNIAQALRDVENDKDWTEVRLFLETLGEVCQKRNS